MLFSPFWGPNCYLYLYRHFFFHFFSDSNEAEEPCTVAFLESSNWVERSLCRSVIGPLIIDITSGTVHRLEWILECITNGPPRPTYGQEEIGIPFFFVQQCILTSRFNEAEAVNLTAALRRMFRLT